MTKFDTSIYILQIAVTMDESFEVNALDESIHVLNVLQMKIG